ncbi:class I SAM-dependent methyltransferase [Paracoccaceae bacterium]|nr:class I SAM-dependent methyltransferase [Paracoccaceae bacterium]
MIIGSIFANLNEVHLKAADGVKIRLKNNFFSRFALKFIGLPHIGMRVRASCILGYLHQTSSSRTLIDAGSGTGIYSLSFAKLFLNVVALEIDQDQVNQGNLNAEKLGLRNLSFSQFDLTIQRLPEEYKNKAQLVICSDVLEHIEADEAAANNLANMLAPGGCLFVTVPRISDFARNVELDYDHKRVGYDEVTLKRLLETTGLNSIYSKQYMKFFGRLAWSVDRKIRNLKLLRVFLFWPLYALASLDHILPFDPSAGGLFMVFQKTE